MKHVDLTHTDRRTRGKDEPFFVLGSAPVDEVKGTILNKEAEAPETLWATLGSDLGSDPDSGKDWVREVRISDADGWRGGLTYSERGHSVLSADGSPLGKAEGDLIRRLYDDPARFDATERSIILDEIDFGEPDDSNENDVVPLRLEVFVKPEENALVFLDSTKAYEARSPEESDAEDEPTPEYVAPCATDKHGFDRKRLRYRVELPRRRDERPSAIRVLTFPRPFRKAVDSDALLADGLQKLGVGTEYALRRYEPSSNDFVLIPESTIAEAVDGTKRTLLLVHGTFVDSSKSFSALLDPDCKRRRQKKRKRRDLTRVPFEERWLAQRLSPNGHYDQILAFDHPTIMENAKQNGKKLASMLKDVTFAENVDCISTSRGGLVVQFLAHMNNPPFVVGKAALVTCANGVGWFETARGAVRLLSLLRWLLGSSGNKIAAQAVALAIHSAEFFLERPGSRQMTPNDDSLTAITGKRPSSKETIYLPVCADYAPKERSDNCTRRWLGRLLELAADRALTKHNDLVVSTENQFTMHPRARVGIQSYSPNNYRDFAVNSHHTEILERQEVRDKIARFLS